MKKVYIIEVEEITTCNDCVFCDPMLDKYGDYDGRSRCMHPDIVPDPSSLAVNLEVTDYMYDKTKPQECPLKELI